MDGGQENGAGAANRDRAFERLRERFHDWDEVRDAPVSEVEEAILRPL